MTTTGLDVFDRTVQKTNEWMNEVAEELHWEDRKEVYLGLRATLQALRDQLRVEEATDLGAQLPMLIRGIYYEGWNPAKTPVQERSRQEFLDHIREPFDRTGEVVDPERVARAVFGLLESKISPGEVEDVVGVLPEDIRTLWPVRA